MKFWIIGLVILILIVLFVGRMSIIEKILFSNKSYAKQIEVKTYILTQEQVSDLFRESNKEPKRLSVEELNKNDKNYFVVRVKNLGSSHAWGSLNCQIPNVNLPVKIPVISIKQFYCDYVVCLSGILISQENNNVAPTIKYNWSKLYIK